MGITGDRPYHHRGDGRFRNPPGSPTRTATFRDIFAFMWRQYRRRTPEVEGPASHVLDADEAQRQLAQHGGCDSLTWLGHASILLRIGGKTLLTDPYLGKVAGPSGWGPSGLADGDR